MSTELFRKYIDILNEDSEEMVAATISEITRLKIALQELEGVLANYEGRIHEAAPPPVPPTPPSGSSTMSKILSDPSVQNTLAAAKKGYIKGRRSLIRGGWQGAGLAAAWETLTWLYDWITSKKLDSLRPGDQEIIKKNIQIIQPWTAPDKLKALDPDLRFRLLHVVDLLEKLGMSLNAQPPVQNEETDPESEPPEATEPQVDQQLLDLLDRAYGQIDESTQIDVKRFVLQNMHLLSEAEQMAARRDMLSEIDWSDLSNLPTWAQAALGGAGAVYGPGMVKKGYDAVTGTFTDQAKKEAEIQAAKDAAEAAARDATAAIDAANQENIRITAQNDAAERQWRNIGRHAGQPRPTPKPLVPVPTMPTMPATPKRGIFQKGAAMIGRFGMRNPKITKLMAAATALVGMAGAAAYYVKLSAAAVEKGVDVANKTVQDKVKEVENTRDLFKRAAQLTDAQLAGTLLQNPEDYLHFAKVVMEFCSGHPNDPKCQESMAKICKDPVLKDLNGGPMDGC
jgi:hypothetical protein